MNEKVENPPAFPFTIREDIAIDLNIGMTMRDYFAAKAMQGMISHSTRYKPREGASSNWHEAISEEAYQISDAMLNERNK